MSKSPALPWVLRETAVLSCSGGGVEVVVGSVIEKTLPLAIGSKPSLLDCACASVTAAARAAPATRSKRRPCQDFAGVLRR